MSNSHCAVCAGPDFSCVAVNHGQRKDPYCDCHDWYVLKVLNSAASAMPRLIEGQNALMTFAAQNGISTPRLVNNLLGQQMSVETLGGKRHIVRYSAFNHLPEKLASDGC
jgi:hypothetical protein